jgi:phosphoenolpyruvate synthase/pyruvate phosphate dikinase
MNYFELLKRKMSVLAGYCAKQGLRDYIKKATGIDFGYKNHIYIFDAWYLDKEEDDALIKILEGKDNAFFKELIDKGYKHLSDLVNFSDNVKKLDVADKNINELKKIYLDFIEKYKFAIGASLHVQLMAWEIIIKRFEKELEKKINPAKDFDKFKKYIFVLTSPKKESPITEEQKELLRLCIEKAPVDKIKKHAENYGWMNVHDFLGKPHDFDYYLNRIKEIKDAKKQLDEIKEKIKNIEKERKKIVNELKPSEEFIKFIELMQEYVYFRNYRRDLYSMSETNIRELFIEIGKRLGLSYEEIICLTDAELADFIESKNKKYFELAKERLKEFAIDRDFKIYSGKNLDKLKKKYAFLIEKVEKVNEIKGEPASPGKAKGPVKVILDVKELNKVNRGDILVANMTTPEYVVAMGKAAAIVTDRGGILCHAAIVSREMGKPCIIGTKIATKVLKDGRLVEVDAEKGIVRKIK